MYEKLFKHCNVLYFKTCEDFSNMVHFLKGKIIISDSLELSKICNINGIIHIVNLNPNFIPNEKIDCIIVKDKCSSQTSSELEAKIIRANLKIPIIYIYEGKYTKWCSLCGSVTNISDNNYVLNKYCSEKCMKKDSGFTEDFKPEAVKDLEIFVNNNPITVTPTSKKISNSNDKFQTSMVKDAVRLQFAFKRESYKKEMRQPSLRKASISDKKSTTHNNRLVNEQEKETNIKLCASITKKGKQCTNKAIGHSLYCGILSHLMSNDNK